MTVGANPETLFDTPALAPGQATTFNTQCPTSGDVAVAARVDATGVVAEGNESNNSLNRTVHCP